MFCEDGDTVVITKLTKKRREPSKIKARCALLDNEVDNGTEAWEDGAMGLTFDTNTFGPCARQIFLHRGKDFCSR